MITEIDQARQAAASWEPFTQNHDPSFWRALREAYAEGFAAGLCRAKVAEDPFESEDYAKFVDSMVPHCHCAGQHRPCDGVLAGGICDNMRDDDIEEDLEDGA